MRIVASASPGGPPPPRTEGKATADAPWLGIAGRETPSALKAVAAAPYALATPPDCLVIARELAELDRLLGPDVDALTKADQGDDLGQTVGRAIGGAVRGVIPYRWAIRWMTQANRMDRELAAAILAGTARRGFLKGVSRSLSCPPPGP